MEYSERQELMTPEEKKKLFRHLLGIAIFFVIVLGGFIGISQIADMSNDQTSRIIFGCFFMFFLGIIFLWGWGHFLDWWRGDKKVRQGVVEERTINRGKKSSNTYYSVTISGKTVTVKRNVFEQVKEGDLVELHYGPYSSYCLSLTLLKEKAVQLKKNQQQEQEASPQQPEQELIKEEPLTAFDKRIMAKKIFKKALLPLAIMIICAGMLLVFILLKFFFIVLFGFFPLLIFFFFFARQLVRERRKYSRDLQAKYKVVYVATIRDRISSLAHHNDFHHTTYTIIANTTVANVNKKIYNAVRVGDRVVFNFTKASDSLIGVITSEGEYLENV